MSAGSRLTPAARRDLVDIAAHLGRESPETAHRFLAAARATLRRLGSNPGLGARFEMITPT